MSASTTYASDIWSTGAGFAPGATPQTFVLAKGGLEWDRLGDTFKDATVETLTMVLVTLLISGILGLVIGMLLYTTRSGGILSNRPVYLSLIHI